MEQFEFVGENLRKARGNKTQEEVAAACEITPSAYSNYEQGIRMPRDEIKLKLANYFGLPVGELFFASQLHE